MTSGFETPRGLTYLDTAGYGLPSRRCVAALRSALEGWEAGTASWQNDWEPSAERCRALFAELIHARVEDVALVPAVSVASALVASAVPQGAEVVTGIGEFRSLLFPFLVAQSRHALRVREVPPERLPEEIGTQTALVAVSHVQSSDGRVTDVASLAEAAHDAGALVYVDATHSLGTLPLDVAAAGIDFLACAAYKWLCCPRGVAFFWCKEEHRQEIAPLAAGWRASRDHRSGGYYGGPLDIATDAARFDISIAWHAWVGASESLRDLLAVGEEERFARGFAVARDIAEGLELPSPRGTIVSVPVESAEIARARLDDACVKATVQRDRIRVSAHFYNSEADGERAVEVLAPLVAKGVLHD